MNLTAIVTVVSEIGVLIGVIIPIIVWIKKIANGEKCQLRSEMLQLYYHILKLILNKLNLHQFLHNNLA